MNTVTLPPDLERFAADAVAQGRYADLSDVVRAEVSLLQRVGAGRAAFAFLIGQWSRAGRVS